VSSATGQSRPPRAVELLERAVGYTRASLVLVTEADLGRPTPCRGWVLHDLLTHMDDSLEAMAQAARATSLSLVPALPPGDGSDLLDSICHRARGLLAHWHAADAGPSAHPGPSTEVGLGDLWLSRELLGSVGALEIALHGWDVAEAIGRPRSIPPGLAMDLWSVARDHITDVDRPLRFGPPVEVSDWATPTARLLAHAGRSTVW
jgi:uncharacterized protein (TIGR03086 family)